MALLVIIKSGGSMQPYLTQIFAAVLLLGLTSEEEELANRLAQIPPGEGKSLVLACLIAYLALVGFKVRCLCYNSYLSNRDSSCFKELYEKLGVEGLIRYVTIEELCLEQLRENTNNFTKATALLTSNSKQSEKEIIR
jgi:preprotein translocase subunit SecA